MSVSYKAVQIELLDGSDLARSIYKKTKTREILESIFELLNLIEKDYFGLYFYDVNTDKRVWLKPSSNIWSPIVKSLDPPYQLYFGVRYFPYDPMSLREDITLYMIYLQLRREVKSGRVICTDEERVKMLSYMLQAEAGDYDMNTKYRNFFLSTQGISPEMEASIIRSYEQLSGLDPQTCEIKVMSNALQATYYNQEVYPVRSDSQPGLRRLTFALGPIGIGIFQNDSKLDIYGWMEIWHVGWINRTFWFRIMRDGEKSKHKFHFEDSRTCEHVWKRFRDYFRFYVQERTIDAKLMYGRVPPKVNRIFLFSESNTPQRNMAIKPKISRDNINGLVKDSSLNGSNNLLREHYGEKGASKKSSAFSIYEPDNSLKGGSKASSQGLTKSEAEKLRSLFQTNERKPGVAKTSAL